ncbi:hypothetical protein HZA33_04645 [Candidatus Pacearchaeota archaeon]|nr:hypothetical protein [Candidatus Pacearchaeota archaeon]
MKKKLKIAYTCNVRPEEFEDNPEYGEWESPETIKAVTAALEASGNKVELVDADRDVYHKLLRMARDIDIVFNNSEGLREVEIREAIVPFFCEVIGLPYTGSGPQTLINALDKPTTKEILLNYGIKTPLFQTFESYTDRLEEDLKFPLMVKPISEGTSIGITQASKVSSEKSLLNTVKKIIKEYKQPALVEEFLHGKEYTVGIIGRYILPILMLDFNKVPGKPDVRDPHVKDIENPYMEFMDYNSKGYINLSRQAAVAFDAMSCNDYCRMDFREKDGVFYFLEMNPLPGIHPTEADLTNICKHAGISHTEMISLILYEGVKRYRRDNKFSERFPDEKISGIVDIVEKARGKIEFYKKPLMNKSGDSYRLVKPEEK